MLRYFNRFSKREKYTHNGDTPVFSSEGGADLWKLVTEIYAMQKSQAVEIRILGLAVLGIVAAGFARVMGAF